VVSYSGADINIVVRDALMQPIRRLQDAQYFREADVKDGKSMHIYVGLVYVYMLLYMRVYICCSSLQMGW
jgi:SpoVK/Ycf46/Vps4 family AAA+-type ATPase